MVDDPFPHYLLYCQGVGGSISGSFAASFGHLNESIFMMDRLGTIYYWCSRYAYIRFRGLFSSLKIHPRGLSFSSFIRYRRLNPGRELMARGEDVVVRLFLFSLTGENCSGSMHGVIHGGRV